MSVNPTKDFYRENLSGKVFAATVVDNNDPTRRQRVRVRVDGPLHQGVPDGDLPWAIKLGEAGHGTTSGVQQISIPPIGAKVIIMMMDNSDDHPIYLGAAHLGGPNGELVGADYTHCYGWVDQANNLFLVNTAQRTAVHHYSNGAKIFIDSAGGIHSESAAPSTVSTAGTHTVIATGEISVQSNSRIVLSAPSVTLAPGGSASFTPTKR